MKLIKNTVGALYSHNSQHDQAELLYERCVCACVCVCVRGRKEEKMVSIFILIAPSSTYTLHK